MASLAAVVAIVTAAVSWLITDGPEPPAPTLSKVMGRVHREASLTLGQAHDS